MQVVGIKELKNKLTYYLRLVKEGDGVIVTDRGAPTAILHNLESVEKTAGPEERLASLASRGLARFPAAQEKLPRIERVKAKGRPISELIIEERT